MYLTHRILQWVKYCRMRAQLYSCSGEQPIALRVAACARHWVAIRIWSGDCPCPGVMCLRFKKLEAFLVRH